MGEEMKCPHCHKELKENDIIRGICPHCHKIFKNPIEETKETLSEEKRNRMYCPNCGKEISKNFSFCPYCNVPLKNTIPTGYVKTTSGFSVASLILGIIPVIPIIGSILAIIFGVKAKNRIREDPNLGGSGLATAGITLGILSIFFTLVVAFNLLTSLVKTREQARRAVCMSNLKQIGLALHMYAMDYDEHFPENLSALYPKYVSDLKVFICPSRPGVTKEDVKKDFNICYKYVKGMSELYSDNCLIAYDKKENHKGKGRNVCFVDGHLEWVPEEEWDSVWKKHLQELQKFEEEKKQKNYSTFYNW